VIATLDELTDTGHPRGLEQLTELGELLVAAVRDDCDQEGALSGAATRTLTVQR
jgi:hypothetical protein